MDENKNLGHAKTDKTPVEIPNDEWEKILPKEVYQIAREKN